MIGIDAAADIILRINGGTVCKDILLQHTTVRERIFMRNAVATVSRNFWPPLVSEIES